MTRKVVMSLVALMMSLLMGLGCGRTEEDGWDIGDEPIVIWTIPRPGEDPANNETPDEPDDVDVPVDPMDQNNVAQNNDVTPNPDDPIAPRDPSLPGREPSAAPVACALDYRAVTAPGVLEGALLRGRGDVEEVPCSTSAGAEQRFTINVPRRMGVEIWSTYTETDFSPVLLLQSGCGDATVDLQCSGPLQSHPGEYHAHIRTVLEPGQYTLLIDERDNIGFGEGGAFKIHIDEYDLAHNAMCEGAQRLYPDTTGVVTSEDGSTGDLRSCFPGGTSRRFYEISVGARTAVRVEARHLDPPENTTQGPRVTIAESCYDSCTGSSNYGGVSIANDSDENRTYLVSVNEWRGLDYEVATTRWESIADNASCNDPMVLTPGETVTGDLIHGSPHEPICGSNVTRQLFYSVEVPPFHRLIPETTGAVTRVSQGCSADQCITDHPINELGFDQRYTIRIGDWDGNDASFELTPHVVPVADNSTCFSPQRVEIGEVVPGELVQGGAATGTCSLIFSNGFTLWYEVEIPAMASVRFHAEPQTEAFYLGMHVMEPTCAGACLERYEPYVHGPGSATVEMSNDQPTPKTVYVAVASERTDIEAETIEFTVEEL